MPSARQASAAGSELSGLDPEQQRVANHTGGPLLVLAGPGTGKTATLVEAICSKLRGVPDGRAPFPAHRVLALTFARRAAASLRSRVASRIGDGALPIVSTFHSFAYGLVRRHASEAGEDAQVRLLTAPEQERRLRELFQAAVRDGRVTWPPALSQALGTRGLASELRLFLAEARLHGLSGSDLASIGGQGASPLWRCLAPFLDEYLDVLDAEGVMDYVELVNRATASLEDQREPMFDAVFVDEYQDTDPGQVRMLSALVRPGTTLVAVGDPDQAIYRFRGADVTGIQTFATRFLGPGGAQAPVVVLRQTRRFGPVIRDAAGSVIRPVSLAGLPAWAQRDHRRLRTELPGGSNDVTVAEFPSGPEHAAGVADLVLREVRAKSGRSWSDIAVLVRSGIRDLPALASALAAAGVPIAVPGDDILLREEPGVAPLLLSLRVAARVQALTPDTCVLLAESPLGRVSPLEWRGIGRVLRSRALSRVAEGEPRSSADGTALLAAEMSKGEPLVGIDLPGAERVRELARLLSRLRGAVEQGEAVPDLIWRVWSATDWPDRLAARSEEGGATGRAADRILDSVLALFDIASRSEGRGSAGLRMFLAEIDTQLIPGGREVGRNSGGDRVTLSTAHRSKGLEWPVVLVAAVHEGDWPDARRRSSLLESDRLADAIGGSPPVGPAELLADERRLFYVACTRAKERLVVTAVRSEDESGPQPSQFVDEVRRDPRVVVRQWADGGEAIADPASLVADLRVAAEDPHGSTALRGAARDRLVRLAAGDVPGQTDRLLSADPKFAWGGQEWTVSDHPLVSPDTPVRLSGSAWMGLDACPLRWFLSRHARADRGTADAAAFGSVVHALADAVVGGELPSDEDALLRVAQEVWPHLGFEAPWQAQAEFAEARDAVARLIAWHKGRRDRECVGSELRFETTIDSDGGAIALSGFVDRLEIGPDGLHVVDLKTQRRAIAAKDLPNHRQLQAYQLAAATGAFDAILGEDRVGMSLGGAELVLLRVPDCDGILPKIQHQDPIDGPKVISDLAEAAALVRQEVFSPNPSGGVCRFCDFAALCPEKSGGGGVSA